MNLEILTCNPFDMYNEPSKIIVSNQMVDFIWYTKELKYLIIIIYILNLKSLAFNPSPAMKKLYLKLSPEVICCMWMLTEWTNFSIQTNSVDPEQQSDLDHTVCYRDVIYEIAEYKADNIKLWLTVEELTP